ncbi:pilin [Patescibacteria group bacterium]|nr:pilin [Patescibacteria group bacterium]
MQRFFYLFAASVLPFVAGAAQPAIPTNNKMTFAYIVNQEIVPFVDFVVVPLLYAIAFLLFLIGVVRFLFSMEDEKRNEGKKFIFWGIIGFVVLFSVWGLVKLLLSVLTGGV